MLVKKLPNTYLSFHHHPTHNFHTFAVLKWQKYPSSPKSSNLTKSTLSNSQPKSLATIPHCRQPSQLSRITPPNITPIVVAMASSSYRGSSGDKAKAEHISWKDRLYCFARNCVMDINYVVVVAEGGRRRHVLTISSSNQV